LNILGISAFYHDSAACLVRDGKILAAAQEERFTRIKHDPDFPRHAAEYCLKEGGITVDDLDIIAFYDKPFIKFERLLKSYINYAPLGIRSFLLAMPLWLKQKLLMPEVLKLELGYEGKITFPEHHESHAASAFFPSPFERAAIITFDGVGEWTTMSYGYGEDNRIKILADIRYPHSIGLLYSAFTYYLGFRVNSGEYKVMGLAPYGEPKYKDLILNELIDLKEDGSFKLNMRYFNYIAGLTMTNKKFGKLFGLPVRESEGQLNQKHMDIAASIQVVTEEVMRRTARYVHKITGEKNLCLAGGVALNCVGNGKLLREGPFDQIWIQPAAGDAGGALGAALYTWHQYLNNPRIPEPTDSQHGSYLGPVFSDDEIRRFLDSEGIPYKKFDNDLLIKTVADLIGSEKVVGWFSGRMEFGPRALGSRSILGDARSPTMQSVMNLKIKFRESFRPFAPTVLAEKVSDYFEMDVESPYMLLVAPVREKWRRPLKSGEENLAGIDKLKIHRSEIPAITHVDFSARIQTVNHRDNPLYHALIKAFEEKTGCPVIINTSFNVRGEPIVCSPKDAYVCFMRTNIDYLVLGSFLLDKTEQKPWHEDFDWRKHFRPD